MLLLKNSQPWIFAFTSVNVCAVISPLILDLLRQTKFCCAVSSTLWLLLNHLPLIVDQLVFF